MATLEVAPQQATQGEVRSGLVTQGDIDTQVENFMQGEIRSGFIRKVYGILSVQLLVTGAIAFPISRMPLEWVKQNIMLCQACMLTSLVLIVGVSCCCQEVARKVPYNYIFLILVTICESVLVGFICTFYTGESVVIAAFMTSGIFVGLTIYAMTTKSDFTGMGMYLFAALIGLILMGFVAAIFPGAIGQKVLGGFGAILFSFYIVYDTQLIVGGKHKKHSIGVDDYVFAALNIYLDIINLFIYLLQIFGNRR